MRGVLGSQFYVAVILLFMALLTMRLISEEKKLGTIELLMTAPIRDSELVMGKFLGSVFVMLAMFAFTLYFPMMLMIYGDPDLGPIFSGYLGLVLLGVSSLAVGSVRLFDHRQSDTVGGGGRGHPAGAVVSRGSGFAVACRHRQRRGLLFVCQLPP